jgi:hypothetical protein
MLLCLLASVGLGSLPAAAQSDEQMQFQVVRSTSIAARLPSTPFVFASGVIDPGATTRFQALVEADKLPPAPLVFFDSLGGNLLAGMELGRDIRKTGFIRT